MLHPLDYVVIVLYLSGVVYFGIRSAGRQQTTRDYFLGSRELPWWAISFSIVATETSTLTVIGIPAVAYGGTMTFFQLTFGYLLGRVVVAFLFLPRYMAGDMQTAYTYLGERFGVRMQRLSSVTFLGTRLLADGVRLFATAIPIRIIALSAGVDLGYPMIILGIGILTAIYTYVGGFKAVVWMDVVQMSVYLVGAIVTIGLLLGALPAGAWSDITQAGKAQVFFADFSLQAILTQPYVLITAVIGGGVFSMASHGTDQLIVQRLLSCKDLGDARKALIGSAFFVMGQFAVFLIVGALLWAFYDGASAAQLGLGRLDEVFPKYIIEQLPVGVAGLVLAGILAAAMSTLSSSLNALASSSITDLFGSYFSKKDDAVTLKMSRYMTLGWALVFVFFATLFESRQNPVVELGLSIASFTYGSLLGAFLLGQLVKRVQERDALIAFVVGVIAMILIIFGVWITPDGSWMFMLNPEEQTKVALSLSPIAWPWYTAIGSGITILIGSLLSLMHR
ncbi:MAG: sodium/solute symporter [Bacteroidetes Order II. Incertae sedis bacterium]|jgi:solute:Na+ symporter, SSS family|nr:sodium/solute symporter [Bacteroidetes Order II. bacterium]MBT4602738.1 sodium/solute symporter [Bacteroidetes Order II. bacterium]MBT5250569.1 sodium/solute symporter [Bacteroidetes Order II. bacterium]MBT6201246.1 sodium/solute symporter [Bacteroidetes Order II. bacterium]MBT6424188.1 sodium/solute symporter [Bacteroidetes Order II. bacterium]